MAGAFAVGPVKQDTLCGAPFKFSAPRLGESKPLIHFGFIYDVQRDYPDFPGLSDEVWLDVEIERAPSSPTSIDVPPSFSAHGRSIDAWPASGVVPAAAASVFNCIPVVVEGPTGLFDILTPGAWELTIRLDAG